MTTRCGWCMTNSHSGCKYKIEYFDKVWLCTCVECHPERESGDEDVAEPTSED